MNVAGSAPRPVEVFPDPHVRFVVVDAPQRLLGEQALHLLDRERGELVGGEHPVT